MCRLMREMEERIHYLVLRVEELQEENKKLKEEIKELKGITKVHWEGIDELDI